MILSTQYITNLSILLISGVFGLILAETIGGLVHSYVIKIRKRGGKWSKMGELSIVLRLMTVSTITTTFVGMVILEEIKNKLGHELSISMVIIFGMANSVVGLLSLFWIFGLLKDNKESRNSLRNVVLQLINKILFRGAISDSLMKDIQSAVNSADKGTKDSD